MSCTLINDFGHVEEFVHILPNSNGVVSILEKKPCKLLFDCPQINDKNHTDKYIHACHKNCQTTFDTRHNNSFTHPCRYGSNCKDSGKEHCALYQHPVSILKKKACSSGPNCQKTSSESHKDEFYHKCQYDTICKHFQDEIHLNRFTHSCTIKNCLDTTPLHLTQFIHQKQSLPDVKPLEWIFLSKEDDFISVCSFNLLAQQFISPQRYQYVQSKYLDWNYRKKNLLEVILSVNADILCLQEVDIQTHDIFVLLKQLYEIHISSTNTLATLIRKYFENY
jgi:hypothetical protein